MRKHLHLIAVIFGIIVIIVLIVGIHLPGPDAEINLVAPDSYQIGELIVLDATESISERLQWTILPETKNFKIVGETAYFSSSAPDRYTVIITATNNGTLATKVIFLTAGVKKSGPNTDEVEPLKIDPKVQRLALLIDGGIISTLDAAVLAALKLGVEIPEFKNFEEFKHWVH